MAFNINRSFEVENGISIINPDDGTSTIMAACSPPLDYDAPIGSTYLEATPEGLVVWNKNTSGGNGWVQYEVVNEPIILPSTGVDINYQQFAELISQQNKIINELKKISAYLSHGADIDLEGEDL